MSLIQEVNSYIFFDFSYSVAAGQNTTVILAKPNEKFSDMPRHPEDVSPPLLCVGCNKNHGEDDNPLECDKVRFPLILNGRTTSHTILFSAMHHGT